MNDGVANKKGPVEGDLTRKVIRGGFWTFFLRLSNRLLSLARTIILARLLSPNDFGLFGIALLALGALENISKTGFNQALIQKQGNIREHLDTAWVVQISRGLLLGLLLYFGAPLIAKFFDEPNAVMLMKTIGIGVFIFGFKNIGVVYFRKELEFKKEYIYLFSGTVADFGVAVIAAIIFRNAWALIFGYLSRAIVEIIASFLIQDFRPRLRLKVNSFKTLFSFGIWVWISGILIFLLTQGDDIIVGKIISVTALGLYQMAYKISNMPGTEITRVISQVAFPAYSKLQNSIERLREAYFRVLRLNTAVSVFVGGLIFALSPEITTVLLGDKWLPIITPIRILVVWGVIRSLVAGISPVFYSLGNPRIVTIMQGMQTVFLAALIFPLTSNWGIEGASMAVVISSLVAFFVRAGLLIKTIRCRIWRFYKPLVITLLSAALSYGIVYLFNSIRISLPGLINLVVLSILFSITYIIIMLFVRAVEIGFDHSIKEVVFSFWKKEKKI